MEEHKKYTDKCLSNYQIMFSLIMNENKNQLDKWGIQNHNLLEWLAYATEELGELSKAISEYSYRNGNKEDIIDEAIQTATLCIKIAEMIKYS